MAGSTLVVHTRPSVHPLAITAVAVSVARRAYGSLAATCSDPLPDSHQVALFGEKFEGPPERARER
jgi:hypothetical protein